MDRKPHAKLTIHARFSDKTYCGLGGVSVEFIGGLDFDVMDENGNRYRAHNYRRTTEQTITCKRCLKAMN